LGGAGHPGDLGGHVWVATDDGLWALSPRLAPLTLADGHPSGGALSPRTKQAPVVRRDGSVPATLSRQGPGRLEPLATSPQHPPAASSIAILPPRAGHCGLARAPAGRAGPPMGWNEIALHAGPALRSDEPGRRPAGTRSVGTAAACCASRLMRVDRERTDLRISNHRHAVGHPRRRDLGGHQATGCQVPLVGNPGFGHPRQLRDCLSLASTGYSDRSGRYLQ